MIRRAATDDPQQSSLSTLATSAEGLATQTYTGTLPASANVAIQIPSMDSLDTAEGREAMILLLKTETLQNYHDLLTRRENDIKKEFYEEKIERLCKRIVDRISSGGVASIKKLSDGLALLLPDIKLAQADIKNPLCLACESVVVNAFCKMVRHPNFVSTPKELLEVSKNLTWISCG